MALWQYTFYLVPLAQLDAVYGTVPASITETEYASASWWVDVPEATLFQELDALLPRGASSSSGTTLWGTYEGHNILLSRDDSGAVAEIFGRIDLRDLDTRLVAGLVGFARRADAVFFTDDLQLVEPTLSALAASIGQSRAAAFVSDPYGFIERLAREKGSGEPDDAT